MKNVKGKMKKKLTPLQSRVTKEGATEEPFNNAYYNNFEPGIYVDIVSGEPLFSSKDKFHSGTGWPSFTTPLAPENVITQKDTKLLVPRTEVRSKNGDNHLGHLFNDGPQTAKEAKGAKPTGLRYCLNSASLEFVPKEKLEERGYEKYVEIFE